MKLYLPDRAWLVRLRDDVEIRDENSPFAELSRGEEIDSVILDPDQLLRPDILVDGSVNGYKLEGDDRVTQVTPVYWVCSEDLPDGEYDAEYSDALPVTGRDFEQSMGSGRVHERYEDAVRDLARSSFAVRLLVQIADRLPGTAAEQAWAILHGDMKKLADLADHLEHLRDPLGSSVRALAKAKPKLVGGPPNSRTDARLRREARKAPTRRPPRRRSAETSVPPAEPLLQAVLDEPENDLPRLAYADELERRGERPRAEFIRLQCRLETLDRYDPERILLGQRIEFLQRAHGADWIAVLPAWARDADDRHYIRFRRGFVDLVKANAGQFRRRAESLLRVTPIRGMWLHSVSRALPDLAQATGLVTLGELSLVGELSTPSDLAALLASPNLGALKSLNLGFCQFETDGARVLADCPGLPALTQLILNDCCLGPEGTSALAASPHLSGLRHLDLRSNEVGKTGATALARAQGLTGLESLNLSGNQLSQEDFLGLLDGHGWPALTRLDLKHDFVGMAGLAALIRSPLLGRLTDLDLEGNTLDANAIALLAACPGISRLRRLSLRGNSLTDDHIQALAASPFLANLRELDLGTNDEPRLLTDASLGALASAVSLAGLVKLRMDGHFGLTDVGMDALAASRRADHLAILALERTGIKEGGYRAVLDSPHLAQIVKCNLGFGCGRLQEPDKQRWQERFGYRP